MPTILKINGYRFFFFGFRSHELTKIKALVFQHRSLFLEKWHEYFDGTS